MKSRRALLVLLSFIAFAGTADAAPPPWIEVKSPHFTVLTNASEREGRQVAWEFEQVRQGLSALWPWAEVDGGRPLLIFAARDEETLRSLAPQYWVGRRPRPTSFWVDGVDRLFVALRTDLPNPKDEGENPNQPAYFSYVTAVLLRSFPGSVPEWFSRGLSEVLSNTVVRDKELHIGRPTPRHLLQLREQGFIRMDEFLNAKGASPWLNDEVRVEWFNAQAWLLVHCLMFGENGVNRGRIEAFGQLLHDGESTALASIEAFDRMAPFETLMTAYQTRGIYRYERLKVDVSLPAEGFKTRRLSVAEAALERAHFLASTGRPVEARALAKEAQAADPAGPAVDEVEAMLQDFDGKPGEARKAFERAAARGSRRGHAYFRLAQLELETGETDRSVQERAAAYLERAAQLDPWHATSLSLLSMVKLDLGRVEEAIALAQRAIELAPVDPFHRIHLARALNVADRRDEALSVAQTAVRIARDDQDRESAQEFLDYLKRPPRRPAQAPGGDSNPAPAHGLAEGDSSGLGDRESGRGEEAIEACVADQTDGACASALPFLQASCGDRVARSCRVLGSLFEAGRGVAMDKVRAAEAYDAGCRGAMDKPSCVRYAVFQVEGVGVAKDEATGLATLQSLCAEGVANSCISWALLLSKPSIGDLGKARSLLQTECDARSREACTLLKALPAR